MPYDQGAYRQNQVIRRGRGAGFGSGGAVGHAMPTMPMRGGGGHNWTAQQQAAAIQIPPLEISAERDPYLDKYMGAFDTHAGEYDTFRKDVAEGIDQDAVNAMQRQRDLTSGAAREAYEGRALATGGDTGLASRARTHVLTSGARDASALNATMAASGRQAQLAALQGKGGAISGGAGVAGNSAANILAQQNHALNVWQAQRQAQQAAEAAAMAREQMAWERQMDLANMLYTG